MLDDCAKSRRRTYKQEVTGSSPVPPTREVPAKRAPNPKPADSSRRQVAGSLRATHAGNDPPKSSQYQAVTASLLSGGSQGSGGPRPRASACSLSASTAFPAELRLVAIAEPVGAAAECESARQREVRRTGQIGGSRKPRSRTSFASTTVVTFFLSPPGYPGDLPCAAKGAAIKSHNDEDQSTLQRGTLRVRQERYGKAELH